MKQLFLTKLNTLVLESSLSEFVDTDTFANIHVAFLRAPWGRHTHTHHQGGAMTPTNSWRVAVSLFMTVWPAACQKAPRH